MKDYSVVMALFDLVPVIFFTIGAICLQRECYERMTKGPFALFAAGTIDVACAGFCKAIYKFLYVTGICDFSPLSAMFFPVQSIGFMLAGVAMIAMNISEAKRGAKMCAVAPVLWKGTFLFVGLMVAGLACMDYCLIKLCVEKKKKNLIVLFVISFICCLGMGYLSSKDFSNSSINWIAELINFIGQGTFLLGAIFLRKKEEVKE